MTTYRCQCGEWSGYRCEFVTDEPDRHLSVVELMPSYLRESTRAAGGWGVWPHNGAIRIAVAPDCYDAIVSADEEWVIRRDGEKASEYVQPDDEDTGSAE